MNLPENIDEPVNNIPDELPNQDEDSNTFDKNSGADAQDIEIIDKASEPSYVLDVDRDELPVKEHPETEEEQQKSNE